VELNPITKDTLKAGDIFLCKIPDLSFWQYMASLRDVVAGYASGRGLDMDAASPLIHWIIGYFDRYHYFHASFWNGKKLVESRIAGGLRENDIGTYANDIVDVYRYQKDGHWVGSPQLPVDPLLHKAQSLVDRHWPYGFDSAYLLAILCVTRWERAKWVDGIRDILIRHVPSPELGEQIEKLIERFRPQIDALIEHLIVLALDAVRKYRKREGYVCSQTVAVIYNEATDARHAPGTYEIEKPTYALRGTPALALVAQPRSEADGVAACEDLIRSLGVELERLPKGQARASLASPGESYESWQAFLREDSFYTPRDLSESGNTQLVGRLEL
jgi:hypothetical protein